MKEVKTQGEKGDQVNISLFDIFYKTESYKSHYRVSLYPTFCDKMCIDFFKHVYRLTPTKGCCQANQPYSYFKTKQMKNMVHRFSQPLTDMTR